MNMSLQFSYYHQPLCVYLFLHHFLCQYKDYIPTFALSSHFVPEYIDLIDRSEIFKHGLQLSLVHGPWDLTHKHFDRVSVRLLQSWRSFMTFIFSRQCCYCCCWRWWWSGRWIFKIAVGHGAIGMVVVFFVLGSVTWGFSEKVRWLVYKSSEFKVTYQAWRHNRSLVCIGCGRGRTDGHHHQN